MFEAYERYPVDPPVPAWLARDLGLPPGTRVGRPRGRRATRGTRRMSRGVRAARVDELGTIPLFEDLPKRARRCAAKLSTTSTFPAGTMLTQQGAVADEFFVLLDGEVEVYRGGRIVATKGPGAPIGEVALLERTRRTATVLATTPVSTLVYGRPEFDTLLRVVPELSERLRVVAPRAARPDAR